MDTKVCRHCGQKKSLIEFQSRKTVAGGRSAKCKECIRNKVHTYKTNREKLDLQNSRRAAAKLQKKEPVFFEHDSYYRI